MTLRFILNILGSASAKPTLVRESSAQLLQAAGRLFLIDCSENTQQRILLQNRRLQQWVVNGSAEGVMRLSPMNIDALFISHIHGDHVFGLFPLLSTMSMNGRKKPLNVFGPVNLGPLLTFYESFWGANNSFGLRFIPIKAKSPEIVYETPGLSVKAFPLNHGIDTFGYLFSETGACTFKKEAYKPRSFAYCSDTAPVESLAEWIKGVDLLYHEATYMQEDFRKARERFHSTTEDAARCAAEAGAGHLLLGHYSASVGEDDINGRYIREAREIFPQTTAVNDGDIFDLPLCLL